MLVQVAEEQEVRAIRWSVGTVPIWHHWLVQPDGSNARQLTALPPMSTRVFLVPDDEHHYLASLDFTTEWKYTDITDPDRPQPALTLPFRANAWRIRSLGYLYR